MIPVRDHILASSRTYIYFFGFFQLSKFPNSYRRRILVLVIGSILAMLGWASYMAVTKPWELRDSIVENKLLSLGASTFLDANIVGRVIDTYSEDIDFSRCSVDLNSIAVRFNASTVLQLNRV